MRTELDDEAIAKDREEVGNRAAATCEASSAAMMRGIRNLTESHPNKIQAYWGSMLLDEIRQFLRQNGIRLDTEKGQHFLIDECVLADIVAAARLTRSDLIVEIGPGIGILTRELLKHVAHVTAVEIDPSLIPFLRVFTGIEHPTLEIINDNALHVPLPEDAPYKIVANIPYHITSPLLTHVLIEANRRPESLTLLIQREVAENICSQECSSILAVLVRLFGTPSLIRLVEPDCFFPPPKVNSAVLSIACFAEPKTNPEAVQRILKLAKLAFTQRRKMLSNSIGEMPKGNEAMESIGVDVKRRPQTLTIDEWIALEDTLQRLRSS